MSGIYLDLAVGNPSQAAQRFAVEAFQKHPEHYRLLVKEITRVDRNPDLRRPGRKRAINDQQLAQILKLSARGMSAPRIGELLGIADYNITAALRRHRRQENCDRCSALRRSRRVADSRIDGPDHA